MFLEYNQPRDEFFRDQPYRYSQNPFTNLATASWDENDTLNAIEGKQKQIVLVRTLEPDKLGKSKK